MKIAMHPLREKLYNDPNLQGLFQMLDEERQKVKDQSYRLAKCYEELCVNGVEPISINIYETLIIECGIPNDPNVETVCLQVPLFVGEQYAATEDYGADYRLLKVPTVKELDQYYENLSKPQEEMEIKAVQEPQEKTPITSWSECTLAIEKNIQILDEKMMLDPQNYWLYQQHMSLQCLYRQEALAKVCQEGRKICSQV